MKPRTHVVSVALTVAAVALAGGATIAQRGRGAGGADAPTPAFTSDEYLLFGNATRGAGEPMVAVDPVDPRHIIVVAMGNLHLIDGKQTTGNDAHHHVAGSTINWLGVTHDAGMTWDVKEQPILSGKLTRCPDAFADVMKDGTFIAGCEPRETAGEPDFLGMSALQISRDHGQTWGPMVQMISDYQLDRFAPGLRPVSGGFPKGAPNRVASNSPWDRPYTYIDDSTGVIYGVAQGGSAVADAAGTQRRPQSYITASTDGGKSFGTVYSWDSPEYPQSRRGIGTAAAHGALAVMYVAGSAPPSANASCPCTVWGLSRDRGKTFAYHVLTNLPASATSARAAGPPAPPVPASPGATTGEPGGRRGAGGRGGGSDAGVVSIAADQTKAGRFAMLVSEGGPKYSLAVSEDYGHTWSTFVTAGTTPDAVSFSKPRLDISRDGVVGLMWRASYADRSYDIWASISRDAGKTFSKALRVSHAKSPASDPRRNGGGFGDDIQDLSMDRQNMHVVWGDSRSGFQGVWYGRVKLADFEF